MKQLEFSSNTSKMISDNYFTLILLIWKQRKENYSGHCQKDHQEKSVNLILRMKVIKHLLLHTQYCLLKYSQLIIQKTLDNHKESQRLWSMQLRLKSKILFQVHKNRKKFNKWMKNKKKPSKKCPKVLKSYKFNQLNKKQILNSLLKS